jgi:flagellin
MQSQAINTQSAESTIRDANMATEISNLTKFQILSQTGMAALSQANTQSQSIMSLMRNLG